MKEDAQESETIRSGDRTWPLPEGARRIHPDETPEDIVDEAARESFPASDPPGFNPRKTNERGGPLKD